MKGWVIRPHSDPVLALEQADGTKVVTVDAWSMVWDPRRGRTWTLDVRSGTRSVQVGVSPKGKTVRVFVDGKEVEP